MKLESCATLNYTIEKSERRLALTNEQMKSDSPYNTYKYKGLPPTPISNPGIDAILAAARPADTNYLYLCAMGDGRTAFATTLSGHEKNIAKYKDNW